jgi:transcriptional regulator with XRE-family HTH domain
MGVGTLQIYRWESGQNDPSGDSISRLAKVLDVTADYLLGLTDNIYKVVAEGDLSPMESKLIAAVRHGQIVEALEAMTALTKGTDQSNVTTVEPAIDR